MQSSWLSRGATKCLGKQAQSDTADLNPAERGKRLELGRGYTHGGVTDSIPPSTGSFKTSEDSDDPRSYYLLHDSEKAIPAPSVQFLSTSTWDQ